MSFLSDKLLRNDDGTPLQPTTVRNATLRERVEEWWTSLDKPRALATALVTAGALYCTGVIIKQNLEDYDRAHPQQEYVQPATQDATGMYQNH